jgi:DNA-directed RNA polymerase specialized sigma24 family protein
MRQCPAADPRPLPCAAATFTPTEGNFSSLRGILLHTVYKSACLKGGAHGLESGATAVRGDTPVTQPVTRDGASETPGVTPLERAIRRVYHLCFRMIPERDVADDACVETFRAAAARSSEAPGNERERELWLLSLAADITARSAPPQPSLGFDELDDVLRSEPTLPGACDHLCDDQRRYLFWELKQGCMNAVLHCLGPGERLAFVASLVLGLSDEEAAQTLGISASALKVRLSRARQKVGDYLAPRCEHVDARNPCRCPSRLGVALKNRFVVEPASWQGVPLRAGPLPVMQRHREAVTVYRELPEPDVPEGMRARVDEALRDAGWMLA